MDLFWQGNGCGNFAGAKGAEVPKRDQKVGPTIMYLEIMFTKFPRPSRNLKIKFSYS